MTYSEVGKRGKKCKSKGEIQFLLTYIISSIFPYNLFCFVDIDIGEPGDLTYAQINTQGKKKTKGKGKKENI